MFWLHDSWRQDRPLCADGLPGPRCPQCGSERTRWDGHDKRHAVLTLADGSRTRPELTLRRGECLDCEGKFDLLPGYLYPHRQFDIATIEDTITRLAEDTDAKADSFCGPDGSGPSERTVRRWVPWLEKLLTSMEKKVEPSDVPVEAPIAKTRRRLKAAAAEVLARLRAHSPKEPGRPLLQSFLAAAWLATGKIAYITKPIPTA
jgi:hypothetical protein